VGTHGNSRTGDGAPDATDLHLGIHIPVGVGTVVVRVAGLVLEVFVALGAALERLGTVVRALDDRGVRFGLSSISEMSLSAITHDALPCSVKLRRRRLAVPRQGLRSRIFNTQSMCSPRYLATACAAVARNPRGSPPWVRGPLQDSSGDCASSPWVRGHRQNDWRAHASSPSRWQTKTPKPRRTGGEHLSQGKKRDPDKGKQKSS